MCEKCDEKNTVTIGDILISADGLLAALPHMCERDVLTLSVRELRLLLHREAALRASREQPVGPAWPAGWWCNVCSSYVAPGVIHYCTGTTIIGGDASGTPQGVSYTTTHDQV